jgi:hypothetical protein
VELRAGVVSVEKSFVLSLWEVNTSLQPELQLNWLSFPEIRTKAAAPLSLRELSVVYRSEFLTADSEVPGSISSTTRLGK